MRNIGQYLEQKNSFINFMPPAKVKTSGRFSTVLNHRSNNELVRLLAETQRRKAATQISAAARRLAAQKKMAWARVARIIKKAEAQYAAGKHNKRMKR